MSTETSTDRPTYQVCSRRHVTGGLLTSQPTQSTYVISGETVAGAGAMTPGALNNGVGRWLESPMATTYVYLSRGTKRRSFMNSLVSLPADQRRKLVADRFK